MGVVTVNYVPPRKTGRLTDAELEEFLGQPWNARLATVTAELRPYVVPVWYTFDRETGIFYVIGRERSAYVEHIHSHPAVALHIADDMHTEHTRVLVEGEASIDEGPVAPSDNARMREMVDDMARRYLGEPGPGYAAHTMDRPRTLIAIRPQRIQSWTGGEWAAKYYR